MVADGELVARAATGDDGAFAGLVERHRDVVLRVASRMVGRHDAEDVAQDAFLRSFHRLGALRDGDGFRPWLLRITHNAALDHLTRRAREHREGSDADGEAVAAPADRAPARLLERDEMRDRLALKLGGLRPEHRIVLVLRDLEGLPYDEIAAITDTPLGSVKGRLHRARAELIRALRTNTYDWELPGERAA